MCGGTVTDILGICKEMMADKQVLKRKTTAYLEAAPINRSVKVTLWNTWALNLDPLDLNWKQCLVQNLYQLMD